MITEREREVLFLLADGNKNSVIARKLGVTDRTVGRITRSLFAKLGAATAAQAVAVFWRDSSFDEFSRQWRRAGFQLALVPLKKSRG